MSRPPRPHPVRSTGREQGGDLAHLDYLPLQYADLLALQEELAVTRLRRPRPQAGGEGEEADVARTFMELSALVAYVLAVYQRQYAGEAYISTAQAASSLVRHARRLAYDPDTGLAASGHVVLVAKDAVSGTVAAGLALASVPLGEIKAQDYETRDDVTVDSALNVLEPLAARDDVVVAETAKALRLEGLGHGMRTGDQVVLLAPSLWAGFVVVAATEDPTVGATTVVLDRPVGATIDVASASTRPVLLARPALELRQFGADADPSLFAPSAVRSATAVAAQAFPHYRYVVERPDGAPYDDHDVYLSELLSETLTGQHVLRTTGADRVVLRISAETVAAVTLEREAQEQFTTHTVALTPTAGGGFTSTLTPTTVTQTVRSRIAGSVTAVRATDRTQQAISRPSLALPAQWLTGWATGARLAAREPSSVMLDPRDGLALLGQLLALTPGRALVFSNRAETVAQIVTIRRAELAAGVTRIWWDPVDDPPAGGWALRDLKVFGNVVRVSHGRTVQETLGGSDGVTAFQRFALGQSPLTVLPGVAGGEPELAVRVDDVLWTRVADFSGSAPDDRHYRSVTDEQGVTTIVFGDGRNGAVPPSGDGNLRASYRVGLGRVGDVQPRRLSRLKRAHPLLDRAVNMTPVRGGAEPADPEAIRSQSTGWIRTFDRAVSVSDLADLALMMPGIARSAARSDGAHGVVLVVATAAGDAPAQLDAVRAFLDARRDTTIALALRGPRPRDLQIAIDVEPDPAHLAELVKDAVRAALHGEAPAQPGMFTFPARGLGQPAYLSEVYDRLEAVPGVIGVRVDEFASRTGRTGGVADVIAADVDEWLRLGPNDLTVTVAGSTA